MSAAISQEGFGLPETKGNFKTRAKLDDIQAVS